MTTLRLFTTLAAAIALPGAGGWIAAGFFQQQQPGSLAVMKAGPPPVAGASAALLIAPGASARERLQALAQMMAGGADYRSIAGALIRHPQACPGLLESVLEAWMATDPAAAVAWNEALPGRYKTKDLLERWMDRDPTAALAFAQISGPHYRVISLIQRLAKSDAKEAWRRFQELPKTIRDQSEYAATGLRLKAGGLTAMSELLEEATRKGSRHVSGLNGHSDDEVELLKTDPAGVLALWQKHDGPEYHRDRALTAWAKLDHNAALAWGEANLPTDAMRARIAVGMAETDSQGAWELAQTLSADRTLEEVGEVRVKKLMETDPAKALEFAAQATSPKMREKFFEALAGRQNDETPEAARLRCEALLPDARAAGMGPDSVAKLMDSHLDPTAMTEWIKTQPADDQLKMIAAHADSLANNNPGAAAAIIAESAHRFTKDNFPTSQLATAMAEWAGQSPEQAAALAGTLPPGKARDTAVANTVVNWFFADQGGALTWLDQQPAGTGRDLAVTEIMSELSNSDPARAAQLAAGATTEAAQKSIIYQLKVATPEFSAALRQALQARPWSGAQQEEVMKKLTPP